MVTAELGTTRGNVCAGRWRISHPARAEGERTAARLMGQWYDGVMDGVATSRRPASHDAKVAQLRDCNDVCGVAKAHARVHERCFPAESRA